MKKIGVLFSLIFLLVFAGAVHAAPIEPLSGTAVVNGVISPGEWPPESFIGTMHRAGNTSFTTYADVYAMQNNGTVYVWTQINENALNVVTDDPADAFVKVNGVKVAGAEGGTGEFAYVLEGAVVVGFEASFDFCTSDGSSFLMDVHMNIFDGEETQTAANEFDILVECSPTAVSLATFSVTNSPFSGTIMLLMAGVALFSITCVVISNRIMRKRSQRVPVYRKTLLKD